jgi:hypothetical protein
MLAEEQLIEEPLYTVRESAELVRCAYDTMWYYVKIGKVMRTKVGGKVFIRRSQLRKLIVDQPKKTK